MINVKMDTLKQNILCIIQGDMGDLLLVSNIFEILT